MFLKKEELKIIIEKYLFEEEENQEKNIHVIYLEELPADWGLEDNKMEIKLHFQNKDDDEDNHIEVITAKKNEIIMSENNKNKLLGYIHIAILYASGKSREEDINQLLRMAKVLGVTTDKEIESQINNILNSSKPADISSILNTYILKGSTLRNAAQDIIDDFTKNKVV